MIRFIIGLIVFGLASVSLVLARSNPDGGTYWLGGLLVGLLLMSRGLWAILRNWRQPGRWFSDDMGDAPAGSVQSRWFTSCEVCAKTIRIPAAGQRPVHPECLDRR